MDTELIKARTKYLKATNSLLLIAGFIIIRTIFFVCGNDSMIHILEINRLINELGTYLSSEVNTVLGIITPLGITLFISTLIFFIWRETQKGNVKIFVFFTIFYFLDMFLYFYSKDVLSFILHFIFLAYMMFGMISFKKMYVIYTGGKNKEEK